MPEFLENVRNRGEGIPDTTEPWRYFPLEVGNTWEYLNVQGNINRRYVEKDTIIGGYQFFIMVRQNFTTGGSPIGGANRIPLRFDTLTARVLTVSVDGHVPYYFECPFDLPFGVTELCNGQMIHIDGGYDRLLVFPRSIGDPDSVYTALKIMDNFVSDEYRFAADFGEVYHFCYECSTTGKGLQAVRLGGWDGQVYGELHFPPPVTSNEDWFSSATENNLEVWPNPARSSISLQLRLPEAAQVHVSVLDLLGREVLTWEGTIAGSEETIELDVRALATGSYIVRMHTANHISRGVLFTRVE